MFRIQGAIVITVAALALSGCTGGPASSTAAGSDPKESCRSFEAATNSFIGSLAKPEGGAAERALTSMNEAAAYANGDVQKAMGEAMLILPPSPADLGSSKGEAQAVNNGLGHVAEACRTAGAEITLHAIPVN